MELLQLLSIAAALFLGWVFIMAGVHKLNPTNDAYFAALISDYGWGNENIAKFIAKLVGVIELITAVGLIYPGSRPSAAIVAASLLFGYMLHMAYQLYQGRRDLDCGCSGPGGQLKMSGHLIVRNLLMVGLCIFCVIPSKETVFNIWLLGMLLASIGVLVSLSSEQLISNAQKLKALRT